MYSKDSTKLEVAQYYVSKGLSVLPIHVIESDGDCSCRNVNCDSPAKHPLTTNGVDGATKDSSQLKEYFSGDYEIANIAVAVGQESGIWILDVDDLKPLTELTSKHGKLQKTPLLKTQSGTWHYHFKYDDRCKELKNRVKFCGSLDVRTNGGYALLPPSVGELGRYEWLVSYDDCEPAPAPDWLIEAATKTDKPAVQETAKDAESKAVTLPRSGNTSTETIQEPTPEPNPHQGTLPESTTTTPPGTITVQRATTTEERIILYLEKTPPAISGDHGHGTTFGVMCKVVEFFGEQSDDVILNGLSPVLANPPQFHYKNPIVDV